MKGHKPKQSWVTTDIPDAGFLGTHPGVLIDPGRRGAARKDLADHLQRGHARMALGHFQPPRTRLMFRGHRPINDVLSRKSCWAS